MYCKQQNCMAMTFLCRCWRRVTGRPRRDGCGPMSVMIARGEIRPRRGCGLPILRTAKESIRNNI